MEIFDILLGILSFIIGTCFASFFGVVCYRIPRNISIIKPDSKCFECGHKLKWFENIPLLSYIFLGGKCSQCKTKIGFDSFMFELIGGILCLLVYLKFKVSYTTIFVMLITLNMLIIAMYDYYTNTILDIFWICLLVLVIVFKVYTVLVLNESFKDLLIGCVVVSVLLLFVKLIFYLILKKDALGNGDIILMAIGGAMLGTYKILFALMIGSLVGSIIEIILISFFKKDREKQIPFCPYLTLGLFISLLYGSDIINFVLEMI